MFNEEDFIRQRIGNKNPFTVPEGYFDQLAQQVIDRLPEQEDSGRGQGAIVRFIRPLLYAAACVALAILGTTIYLNSASDPAQQQIAMQETEFYSDSYIDEAADYAMLDNSEIYSSLLADI